MVLFLSVFCLRTGKTDDPITFSHTGLLEIQFTLAKKELTTDHYISQLQCPFSQNQ